MIVNNGVFTMKGTGKTATTCALLKVAASGGGGGPLLACADSNAAVDPLLDGLLPP